MNEFTSAAWYNDNQKLMKENNHIYQMHWLREYILISDSLLFLWWFNTLHSLHWRYRKEKKEPFYKTKPQAWRLCYS